MRNIRRAAVTGLFAIWLAPLSAMADAPKGAGASAERGVQSERTIAESRREQDDERRGEEAAPEA